MSSFYPSLSLDFSSSTFDAAEDNPVIQVDAGLSRRRSSISNDIDIPHPIKAAAVDSIIQENRARTPVSEIQQRRTPRVTMSELNDMDFDEIKRRFYAVPVDTRGPVTRFLDILDLPRNALFNLVAGDTVRRKMSEGDTATLGLARVNTSDVLESLGMRPGLATAVLGFVGDVALDPLTYLGPAGWGLELTSKAGQAVSMTSKASKIMKSAVNLAREGKMTEDAALRAYLESVGHTAESIAKATDKEALAKEIEKQLFGGKQGRFNKVMSFLGEDVVRTADEAGKSFADHAAGYVTKNSTEAELKASEAAKAFYKEHGRPFSKGIRVIKDEASPLGYKMTTARDVAHGSAVAHVPFTQYQLSIPGFTPRAAQAAGIASLVKDAYVDLEHLEKNVADAKQYSEAIDKAHEEYNAARKGLIDVEDLDPTEATKSQAQLIEELHKKLNGYEDPETGEFVKGLAGQLAEAVTKMESDPNVKYADLMYVKDLRDKAIQETKLSKVRVDRAREIIAKSKEMSGVIDKDVADMVNKDFDAILEQTKAVNVERANKRGKIKQTVQLLKDEGEKLSKSSEAARPYVHTDTNDIDEMHKSLGAMSQDFLIDASDVTRHPDPSKYAVTAEESARRSQIRNAPHTDPARTQILDNIKGAETNGFIDDENMQFAQFQMSLKDKKTAKSLGYQPFERGTKNTKINLANVQAGDSWKLGETTVEVESIKELDDKSKVFNLKVTPASTDPNVTHAPKYYSIDSNAAVFATAKKDQPVVTRIVRKADGSPVIDAAGNVVTHQFEFKNLTHDERVAKALEMNGITNPEDLKDVKFGHSTEFDGKDPAHVRQILTRKRLEQQLDKLYSVDVPNMENEVDKVVRPLQDRANAINAERAAKLQEVKDQINAIQKQGAEAVDVRKRSANGEGVGAAHAQEQATAGTGAAQVQAKPQEVTAIGDDDIQGIAVMGADEFDTGVARQMVTVNVNGVPIVFYRSSAGTGGKNAGEWFPMFGIGEGDWFIKRGVNKATGKMNYGVEELDRVSEMLSKRFPPDMSADKVVEELKSVAKSKSKKFDNPRGLTKKAYGGKTGKFDLNVKNSKGVKQHIDQILERVVSGRKAENEKSAASLAEQSNIQKKANQANQQQMLFDYESKRQSLLLAKSAEEKEKAAQNLTRDQAVKILESIEAAPGDDVAARQAIYKTYPDLDPNSVKAIGINDEVQWTSQGVAQFDTPRKITGISDDGKWAFVEGSKTGIPVDQLNVVKKSEAAQPAVAKTVGAEAGLAEDIKRIEDETKAKIDVHNQFIKDNQLDQPAVFGEGTEHVGKTPEQVASEIRARIREENRIAAEKEGRTIYHTREQMADREAHADYLHAKYQASQSMVDLLQKTGLDNASSDVQDVVNAFRLAHGLGADDLGDSVMGSMKTITEKFIGTKFKSSRAMYEFMRKLEQTMVNRMGMAPGTANDIIKNLVKSSDITQTQSYQVAQNQLQNAINAAGFAKGDEQALAHRLVTAYMFAGNKTYEEIKALAAIPEEDAAYKAIVQAVEGGVLRDENRRKAVKDLADKYAKIFADIEEANPTGSRIKNYVPNVITPQAQQTIDFMRNNRMDVVATNAKGEPVLSPAQSFIENFQRRRSTVEHVWTDAEGNVHRLLDSELVYLDYTDEDILKFSNMAQGGEEYAQYLLAKRDNARRWMELTEAERQTAQHNYLSPLEINERVKGKVINGKKMQGMFGHLTNHALGNNEFFFADASAAIPMRLGYEERDYARKLLQSYLAPHELRVSELALSKTGLATGNKSKDVTVELANGIKANVYNENGKFVIYIGREKYVQPSVNISDEFSPLKDLFTTSEGKPIQMGFYPEPIAHIIEDTAGFFSRPRPGSGIAKVFGLDSNATDNLITILRGVDKMTGYWKIETLLHPSWTINDIIGNMFLMVNMGINPLSAAKKSRETWQVIRAAAAGDVETLKSITINGKSAYQHLTEDLGMILGGHGANDVNRQLNITGKYVKPFGYSIWRGIKNAATLNFSGSREEILGAMRESYQAAKDIVENRRAIKPFSVPVGGESKGFDNAAVYGEAFFNQGIVRRVWQPWAHLNGMANDWLKATAYFCLLDEGHNASQAARMVSEKMLDMSVLTSTDKTMRTLIPFWNWMKNSGVLGVREFYRNPKFFTIAPKVKHALEEAMNGEDNLPENARPSWIRDQLALQIGTDPDTRRALTLTSSLPTEAATYALSFLFSPFMGAGALQDSLAYGVNSVTPPLKAIYELGSRREAFTKRTISSEGGDITPTEYMLQQIRPFREFGVGSLRGGPVQRAFADSPVMGVSRLLIGGRLQPFEEERRVQNLQREYDERVDALRRRIGIAEREKQKEESISRRVELLRLFNQMQGLGLTVPKWAGRQVQELKNPQPVEQ